MEDNEEESPDAEVMVAGSLIDALFKTHAIDEVALKRITLNPES